MKAFALALATVLGLFVSTRADASILLGVSSSDGAYIKFDGSGSGANVTFTNNADGSSFNVTSVNGTATGGGLFGSIDAVFAYSSGGISYGPGFQVATLTGSGQLTIGTSSSGAVLTANISGVNIVSAGLLGGFNNAGVINLSGASYSGSNAILTQFATEVNNNGGVVSISYTFDIGQDPTNLADLAEVGSKKTTYAGTLSTKTTAVPEPGTFGLAISGVTMLSLGYYRQRRRKLA